MYMLVNLFWYTGSEQGPHDRPKNRSADVSGNGIISNGVMHVRVYERLGTMINQNVKTVGKFALHVYPDTWGE